MHIFDSKSWYLWVNQLPLDFPLPFVSNLCCVHPLRTGWNFCNLIISFSPSLLLMLPLWIFC